MSRQMQCQHLPRRNRLPLKTRPIHDQHAIRDALNHATVFAPTAVPKDVTEEAKAGVMDAARDVVVVAVAVGAAVSAPLKDSANVPRSPAVIVANSSNTC